MFQKGRIHCQEQLGQVRKLGKVVEARARYAITLEIQLFQISQWLEHGEPFWRKPEGTERETERLEIDQSGD